MAAKGYATAADVAKYLNMDLSAGQEDIVDLYISAAESWLDTTLHRAWLEDTALTEIPTLVKSDIVRVNKPKITTLTSITAYPSTDDDSAIELDATCQYKLIDAEKGTIYVPGAWGLYRVQVVYTPDADAPPDVIKLACMILASSNLYATLNAGADPNAIKSYTVGGELSVTFRDAALIGRVPSQVYTFLEEYLRSENYATL